ncbi:MAG: DNA translocase FtsK 4TM domain-containing protein [Chloroflexota bacterium]|nr:DNA translocase FtsK 4TM domain-containing protein [Chloroflexota bacterium]
MTKRSKKKKSGGRVNWREVLTDPLLQQILALLVIALGVITLLALFQITTGLWADAWIGFLRYWLGWGAYPTGIAILLAGLLWLQHHLDRPLKWRWRPFVGAELAILSLLALTHTIAGRDDPWKLMGEPWGGGLIGWAVSVMLSTYLGWPIAMLVLLTLLAIGLGLTFDVTFADVRRGAKATWEMLTGYTARRQQTDLTSPGRSRPTPGAPRNVRSEPSPARSVTRQEQPQPAHTSIAPPTPQRVAPPPQARPIQVEPQFTPAPAVSSRAHPPQLTLPPVNLLNEPEGPALTDEEIREKSRVIEETLGQFGLPVEVAEVRIGPTVTQFGIKPGFVDRSGRGSRKVRVNQISTLADDLALALAAPRIRVEAPVPGRPVVGIEVPNNKVQLVGLREVMESQDFRKLDSPLAFALGHDVAGEPIAADLSKMPHLLIAGTTGSGKSVCIKAIVTCLIYNNMPDELRLVMIDPKMVELVRFNGLPHLYGQVEVDLERVVKVLRWVAWEMDDRYKQFAAVAARNIDDYNRIMKRKKSPPLPRMVVLIDELADLMMLAPDEVERTLCRIAQMARATGIHLVVATQRPSTDVVTGLIKANFPARISFATVSQIDSRVIIDMPGAETLMGRGDMLFLAADAGYPVRVQGCFVSDEEEERVVQFWREQVGPEFMEAKAPWERLMRPEERGQGKDSEGDELLQQAIAVVRSTGSASASLLQRRLRIGHPRAARLMKRMEEIGVIGPPEAAGRTRRVIIGDEEGEI